MSLLRVTDMTHFFGGLRAVYRYNLTLAPGEIRGLIGPNGAGKTTIFNLITGIHTPSRGTVALEGRNIVGLRPHEIATRGLGRTFQNMLLWRHMTVLEHVRMAHYAQLQYGLFGAFFGSPRRYAEEERVEANSLRLLRIFDVERYARQIVTSLPYGAQRRVEMARAMATRPKVLFLDEPTAGMTPEELTQMIGIIRKIHQEFQVAILLIEHRLKFVMELCQRIQTLVFGEVIAEGTPEEIKNNPEVIEAYLGKEEVA
ncbi:ABC transporter ATP-binding protein [Desulfatitalea alkaliphila]|uniref:ABC transporter ATP-binding protein n=1 Tax=Desulfatitalea alkaliphila TaxID=2929485 RepID=A0AA41R139_9BACT|nr:ABC transporter ATP-binding protein [Desulfatitalea alkaliphila]MCJ8500064.1 ABC transporter ATP-binding protein [Desulfatitalea alkaliphila]